MVENQLTNSRHVSLEKKYEIFGEYVRTVLNLSTGSLVLSITFLHDVVGLGSDSKAPVATIHGKPLLALSWLGFLLSILGCLYYLYFLALASNEERDCSGHLVAGNIIGLAGFGAGLVLFAIFGWSNIP
jgi:hypothetical protein